MNVNKQQFRTIWPDPRCQFVRIIDQTKLPFQFEVVQINTFAMMVTAIKTMQVRGAPLIGAAAAYGIALAMREEDSDVHLHLAAAQLFASRPTAVNLAWAVNRMVAGLQGVHQRRNLAAWRLAAEIAEEDAAQNKVIGQHGLVLIKNQIELQRRMQDKAYGAQPRDSARMCSEAASTAQRSHASSMQFNILTHCNAGWLATVDYGTALAPIYVAHDAGLNIHVWVDETRPRNQGAALTAWELAQHGVAHTVICDNAGGHLMQQGLVHMVIVGADRVAANGDVCNKIGTYLKALAAFDNKIPFYAAVPSPTIDWSIESGESIEIEQRCADEVAYMTGLHADGSVQSVRVLAEGSEALNPAFDVTPARLVTGIITEKGVFSPSDLLNSSLRTE